MLSPAIGFAVTVLSLALAGEVSATRTFNAAPKHHRLRRRDANFEPRIDGNTLFYAEEYAAAAPSSALRISLSPKLPTLIHEDVGEHFEVRCAKDDSSIVLNFQSEDALLDAHRTWDNSEFLFITSQPGCGLVGEHAAFIISDVYPDTQSRTMTLSANSTSLKKSTHNILVDIGSHLVPDLHPYMSTHIIKRQATASNSSSSTKTAPFVPTFSPPSPTISASADVTNKISLAQIDTVIVPPAPAIVNLLPSTDLIENIELKCANCSMSGSIELEAGSFELASEANDDIFDGTVFDDTIFERANDFLNNGFLRFTANNVVGNFEMAFALKPGFNVPLFEARLPDIPLTPFAVPGLFNFGPTLQLVFPVALTLNSEVTLTAGFTLEVPNDSKILLNVSHVESSFTTGFPQAKLTPTPFNISAPDLSFSLTAGFRPQLVLAAGPSNKLLSSTTGVTVEGGIGVFLDLPQLVATVSPRNNVNETCDGPAPRDQNNTRVFVDFAANIAAGTLWEWTVDLPGIPAYSRSQTTALAFKSFPLGSKCLLWSQEDNGVLSPEEEAKLKLQNEQNEQNGKDGKDDNKDTNKASGYRITGLVVALSAAAVTFILL